MKIPPGTKSILCVCTGGKDRSPIMAEYFRSLGYEARAVGISKWHTGQNGTNWCSLNDLCWAHLVVLVSTVHEAFIRGMLRGADWTENLVHIRVVDDLEDIDQVTPGFRERVLSIMREAFPASGGR